jgi:hypothetical protein
MWLTPGSFGNFSDSSVLLAVCRRVWRDSVSNLQYHVNFLRHGLHLNGVYKSDSFSLVNTHLHYEDQMVMALFNVRLL